MNRNKDDRLTDTLLGEAILAIMRTDTPISNATVLRQLQAMAAVEVDQERRKACLRAIGAVRNSASTPKETQPVGQEVRDGDNVIHMFTNDGPPDGTSKH
ncbi:hypothetical protein PMPD1_3705 [Paramixta manurensis]|uniref:Uncharacterized protein n=1 Tax=Paramixta manurensis TaxID=2740817 RepID=A0A6M8UFM9_9GAMM|nr:hypothetical protein PMPD1_3705 [Erwiniaceae bacterium PD-1]